MVSHILTRMAHRALHRLRTGQDTAHGPGNRGGHFPSGLLAAAHIFALACFAVAEPLFDLLSRQAEFFVAHDAQPLDLVLIALLLGVALPGSLLALSRLAARLGAAGRWAHLALVAGLSGLIALLLVKRLAPEVPGSLLVSAAAALAVAFAACYQRWRAVRTFLTFVSPVALLSPILFLFFSPVRQVLLPQEAGRTGERGGTADVPVVMMILDELPVSSLLDERNEIDPLRYPNLAALADDAYWFRDATTLAGSTTVSVPIILTGRIPDRPVLPIAESYPDSLFTWLAGAGYRLQVFETHTRICPRELCSQEEARRGFAERLDAMTTDLAVIYLHLLLPADLAGSLPAINATWHDFADRTIGTRLKQLLGAAPETATGQGHHDTPWPFAAFLESVARDRRPALHFIHLMLPHVPWRFLPSGKEYGPVGAPVLPHGAAGETWGTDRWEVVQGFQRHLLQLGYVDALVGRLLAKLRQQDLYDSALIILVADHGASFRPGASRRGWTHEHFADILNVPLLVKLPGQQQGVLSERNVETIDILPTVADVLGLPLPWPADGQSAIDSGLPERRHIITHRGPRLDLEALRADRRQSVARKLDLFGSGARPGGLFRIGHQAALLGRRASEIVIADPADTAETATYIELDQAWCYQQVDPNSHFIPAHVTGRARFARPRDAAVELAVAINGTVEAVTRTFGHDGDRARFTAMVREEALLAGRNLVEIFEIRRHQPTAVLVSTRQPGSAEYALVRTAGKEAIRSADGLSIPLVKHHLRGSARVQRSAMGTLLAGWAATAGKAPTGARQAAETLLVFIDGRLAFVAGNEPGPAGRRRRQANFRIHLPDALVAGSEKIRMFAILGDAASEIRLKPATAAALRENRRAGRRALKPATATAPDKNRRAGRAADDRTSAPGVIFADGFESGDTSAWNHSPAPAPRRARLF